MIVLDILALAIAIILAITSPGLEKFSAILPLINPVYRHISKKENLNKKKLAQLILLLSIVFLCGMIYKNTFWVHGKILLTDGTPVAGAKVTINNSRRFDVTDKNGVYTFYFFPLKSPRGILFDVKHPEYVIGQDQVLQNLRSQGNNLYITKR